MHLSNTLFFESHLGWTSILVEGNPLSFQNLTKCRPNAHTFQNIISKKRTEVNFVAFDDPLWHTLSRVGRLNFNAAQDEHQKVFRVKSRTFDEIFEEIGLREFEFISVDVEGNEYEVLETIDFNKTIVKVVLSEGYHDLRISDLMKYSGYDGPYYGDQDRWFYKKMYNQILKDLSP